MGAKKDNDKKILKDKIKKDRVKIWRDFGIDENKCERIEVQQTRLEEWLEDVEAMEDY